MGLMRRVAMWSAAMGVVVVGVLLGAGVLSAKTSGPRVRSSVQTFTVNVDGSNKVANETFDAYFPNVVRVHPGDTVVFHYVGVGEPHTATLGTLVDGAVSAFAKLTPAQQNNPPAAALAADAKLPQFTQGQSLNTTPSAVDPCYLTSGVPSPKAPCAKTPTAFDGTQSYQNSGWFAKNARFTVHISGSTRPGTYNFMCLFHREGMTGKIVVVSASTPVPSPSAQAAVGQHQLAAMEAQIAPFVPVVRKGLQALAAAKHVQLPASVTAGTAPALAGGPGIDEYGPKVIKVPVGGSVTWYLLGLHSITFNATKANNDIRKTAPDGTVHFNPAALNPAGGPGEPQNPPSGGSKGKPKFVVVAKSSWNGKGFHNSGVFGNSHGPPLIEGYKITFTHAGTYKFICTVHDNMKGTVIVGG
jgi:plastocyanin